MRVTWLVLVAAALALAACGDDGDGGSGADGGDVADLPLLDTSADTAAPDTATDVAPDPGPDVAEPEPEPDAADADAVLADPGPDAADGGPDGEDAAPDEGPDVADVADAPDTSDAADTPGPDVPDCGPVGCDGECAPGAGLSCDGGIAWRCTSTGDDAFLVRCLGPCDAAGEGCAPLGDDERLVATGEGQIDGVARFDAAAAGTGALLLAWSRDLAPATRVLVTDEDGNVLAGPVALTGGPAAPTRVQVAAGFEGAFAVLAASVDGITLWSISYADGAVDVQTLAEDAPLKLASPVVWPDAVSIYHLQGAAGEEILARRTWPLDGGDPVDEEVDPSPASRLDVTAVTVAQEHAHVYSSLEGAIRVSASTPDLPLGDTETVAVGDHLFADVHGEYGASALLTLLFEEAGERYAYRLHGLGESQWVDVGATGTVQWAQIVRAGDGVVVGLLQGDGSVALAQGSADALGTIQTVWSPTGDAERTDLELVGTLTWGTPRLLLLGSGPGPEEGAVWIRDAMPPAP